MEEKVYTSMYSRNAELYHHGILGMKWGHRNGPPYPLGSDISTGQRLKNYIDKKIETRKENKKNEEPKKTIKEIRKDKLETSSSRAVKQAKKMSDEELKKAYERLNMEYKYAQTTKQLAELNQTKPTLAKRVKKVISKTLMDQTSKIANNAIDTFIKEVNKDVSNRISEAVNEKRDDYKDKKDKNKQKLNA